MRVLVCGATGYLGSYVCRELKSRGHYVYALSRKPETQLPKSLLENVDKVCVAEATKRSDLAGLCNDVDVVFSCLGNHTTSRKPTIWDVDEKANKNILEACLEPKSKVKLFLFVSVLFGDKLRHRFDQAEARERVVDRLQKNAFKSSGQENTKQLSFIVVRPSGFFNDMNDVLMQSKGTTGWLIGSGNNMLNPIHGSDLASYCVDKIEQSEQYGGSTQQYYNVGGPEFLTWREIYQLAHAAWEREAGTVTPRPIKLRSIPVTIIRIVAGFVKIFNVNLASIINMIASLSVIPEEEMMQVDAYGTQKLSEFFTEEVKKHTRQTDL